MIAIDLQQLPARSTPALIARGSDAPPEYLLADPTRSRFVAARWQRCRSRLEAPGGMDCHLLSYCVRGGGVSVIELDGRRHHVQQHSGGVTFVPAGHPVCWAFDCPAAVTHLHLYIAVDGLAGLCVGDGLTAAAMAPRPHLDALYDVRDAWMDGFFRLLMAEHETCHSGDATSGPDLLECLGPLLVRRLHALQRPKRSPASAGDVAPLRPALLRQIEAFVETHLTEPIRVATLAAMASMSVDHFARTFAQATGSTPHRWILDRRLDAARARLVHGRQGLAQIARECGLAGASHLSSSFRRRFGVTPSDFRRGGMRP